MKCINKTITLIAVSIFAWSTVSLAVSQTPTDNSQQEVIQYINDQYARQLPCLSKMEVVVKGNMVTVTFPQLACVTDDNGEILTVPLVDGTVTLADYLPEPKGGYPKGVIQKDGSVHITFQIEEKGAHVMIIDPTYKKGNVQGWIGPSDDPRDQFRQMHGGHIVTAIGFVDGKPVILTPRIKMALCLATPGMAKDDVNDPSVCSPSNQPQAVTK